MSVDVPPVKFPEVRSSASSLPGQNDPAAISRTVDGARERASELAKHHDHDQYSTSFRPGRKNFPQSLSRRVHLAPDALGKINRVESPVR
jgi:hypothetical protein